MSNADYGVSPLQLYCLSTVSLGFVKIDTAENSTIVDVYILNAYQNISKNVLSNTYCYTPVFYLKGSILHLESERITIRLVLKIYNYLFSS